MTSSLENLALNIFNALFMCVLTVFIEILNSSAAS